MSTPVPLVKPESRVAVDHDLLDRVEARIIALGGDFQAVGEVMNDLPIKHFFTPGMYIRTIHMPAGAIVTSKIHTTEHPYIVSQGRLSVMIEKGDWQEITAPYMSVTYPGTRRLLVIHEDTLWTTFHATDLTDPVAVENSIIEHRENPILEKVGLIQMKDDALLSEGDE